MKTNIKKNLVLVIIAVLLIGTLFPVAAKAETQRKSELTYKVTQLKSGKWKTTIYHNSYKLYSYKTAWKPKVKVVYEEDLLSRKLVNREKNHTIYISYFYGKCINSKKDGRIITDSPYNYTSYKYAENVRKGDLVKTYLIFSPYNSYEDDIIDRIDTVIG